MIFSGVWVLGNKQVASIQQYAIWVSAWDGPPVLCFPIYKMGNKVTCLVGLLQGLNELKYTIQEPF